MVLTGIRPTHEKINDKLNEIFAVSNGYFGTVDTWGLQAAKYVNIGCVPSLETLDCVKALNVKQLNDLMRMIVYFEMHMKPLKSMIDVQSENTLDKWHKQTAWSHFATVIMFGLIEVAVKTIELNKDIDEYLNEKGKNIYSFLNKYISEEQQADIVQRYKSKNTIFNRPNVTNFKGVVADLWDEFRSGFVHSAGVHSVPLEPTSITNGGQTKEGYQIMALHTEVPMYEWLIIAWQAILNSYGYKGKLKPN
jgi:hypothetical protein